MADWWEGFWATYNTLIFSIGINAMLAISIALTLSCGLLSLANAAFMGIGAYTAALITLHSGLPFGLTLAAGAAFPASIALLIGVPTLRLSGVYLAMATLGFGEVVRVAILNLDFAGGPMGMNDIPQKTAFWHIALALAATLYVLTRMKRSKIGRAFEAIKEDEIAARLMGIDIARYKLLSFVIGAAIAGLAGGLNAHYTFTIGPGNYAFENAVEILTMAVFGGPATLLGPTLGAAILTLLPEILRDFKEFRLAANGLILVAVILYLPNGLIDPANLRTVWRRIKGRETLPVEKVIPDA